MEFYSTNYVYYIELVAVIIIGLLIVTFLALISGHLSSIAHSLSDIRYRSREATHSLCEIHLLLDKLSEAPNGSERASEVTAKPCKRSKATHKDVSPIEFDSKLGTEIFECLFCKNEVSESFSSCPDCEKTVMGIWS